MDKERKIDRRRLIKGLRILFTIGFVVFAALFINEVWIQPYRSNNAIEKVQKLYTSPTPTVAVTPSLPPEDPRESKTPDHGASNDDTSKDDTSKDDSSNQHITENISDNTWPPMGPDRDNLGRLLHFRELLLENGHFKGWISIKGTNINYPVVQPSKEEPEYYLRRNFFGEKDKAGTIFLDMNSSVEKPTQTIVMHGHNMTSTDNMFHYLLEYNNLNFYKKHPVISFDTIFEMADWKVFSVFITNGSSRKEPLFDYTRSNFKDNLDFLNYIYQLRIRSLFDIDVDIKEEDQLLLLSTCSYELNDYRTVVVARKVRPGEDLEVNVENAKKNKKPLYPQSFYDHYGGNPPKVTSFERALEDGELDWYVPSPHGFHE